MHDSVLHILQFIDITSKNVQYHRLKYANKCYIYRMVKF